MGGSSVTVQDTKDTYVNEQESGLRDISGHWAERIILDLVSRGVVNGYEDNTYRPENPVTKGEFLKLLLEAKKTPLNNTAAPYADTADHWAGKYVNTAFAKQLTLDVENSNTEFGVEDAITRAEAATLIGRLLNPDGTGTPDFTDSGAIPAWASAPVASAVALGIINGMPDGSFAPEQNLTRAEAAAMIQRILNL